MKGRNTSGQLMPRSVLRHWTVKRKQHVRTVAIICVEALDCERVELCQDS